MARSNAGTIRPKRWRWKESWTKLRKKLRRVLAAAPRNAGRRALLGELLSDRGMFEEAQRHLSEAIPAAFQQLAAVKRITEADRPLVERMRNLAAGPSALTQSDDSQMRADVRVCDHGSNGLCPSTRRRSRASAGHRRGSQSPAQTCAAGADCALFGRSFAGSGSGAARERQSTCGLAL